MTVNHVIKKTISRGYLFNLAGKPKHQLEEVPIPAEVIIPLGKAVEPLVKEGNQVKAGQLLVQAKKGQSPVYASVNGRVKAFRDLNCPGGTSQKGIVIEAEQARDWEPLPGLTPNWRDLSQDKLNQLIYSSGVAALDGGALIAAQRSKIQDVIIQGIGDIPYHPAPAVFFNKENQANFLEGTAILKTIFPKATFHLALNSKQEEIIQTAAATFQGINLYAVEPKYPQSFPTLLSETILGKDFKPTDTVVLSATTVLHIYEAVILGKPLIERIISLGGPGWETNLFLRIRIGTPLQVIVDNYLRKDGIYRLIPNNLLTNHAFSDYSFPVDHTLLSLAAIQADVQGQSRLASLFAAFRPANKQEPNCVLGGEIRPCVFCGRCEEVCPAELTPHLLEKYVKRDLIGEDLLRYGIFACIDCNLCTFVCPAKLPIHKLIKLGREKSLEAGLVPKTG